MKEQGAEAYYENWKEKHLSSLHNEMDFTYNEMMLFAESYHQHRLNAITDEDIGEMAKEHNSLIMDQHNFIYIAKALLNRLKGIQ